MDEEEIQYDIYFEGSKDQLFALLYPLTGPDSPIFQHLEVQKITYANAQKKLQFTYQTKQFSNIDRQNESIVYTSTSLPTHSNYFYSTAIPQKNAFVWRSVNRMAELRPTRFGQGNKQSKENDRSRQKGKMNTNEKIISQEEIGEENVRELNLVRLQDEGNDIMKDIEQVPDSKKLNRNWDISKEEYAARLCE